MLILHVDTRFCALIYSFGRSVLSQPMAFSCCIFWQEYQIIVDNLWEKPQDIASLLSLNRICGGDGQMNEVI